MKKWFALLLTVLLVAGVVSASAQTVSCSAGFSLTLPDSFSKVSRSSADDPELDRIRLILTMFPGTQQMIIYCEREKKRIGANCLIHEGLVAELEERLGKENVVVK